MKYLKYVALTIALVIGGAIGFVHMAPDIALTVIVASERSHSGLTRKTITLESGEYFSYLDGGRGEPLVLIHGFGANKDNFTQVAKRLTQHYRVIIPDLTGFGESSRPPNADYRPGAQAERLHRLVAALGERNGVHIGGSSMGGHIAMTWAALYPQEVKSMWLLDPGGVWSAPKSEVIKNYESTGKMPLIATTEDEFLDLFKLTMKKPPYVPDVLLRTMAHENLPHKDLLTKILKEIAADPIEPKLSGVKTPTLLVWGSDDRVLSVECVPLLRRLLPQAKVIVMQDIGHLPMLEAVDQSATDYLIFRDHLLNHGNSPTAPTAGATPACDNAELTCSQKRLPSVGMRPVKAS